MRKVIYSDTSKTPRSAVIVDCDLELLTACVKDGDVSPGEVTKMLQTAVNEIAAAMNKGIAKRKKEDAEE
jgi:hypothetical protein